MSISESTVVSQAEEGDIPALSDLLALLFEQEIEFTPDREIQQRGLAAIISTPERGRILVARYCQRVVGMIGVLFTWSTALGGRVALLEDLIVLPECRQMGIGSLLIDQAVFVARQTACLRITLLTDRDNIHAQAFYQKHGFELSPMIPLRRLL